jgi:hypothetical protein
MNGWRKLRACGVAALCSAASLACSNAAPLGSEQAAIFGGTPAPNDTAVVAIVNFSGGQCSGSLIAPNLVLTARHCVAATADKDVRVVCGQTPFEPPDSAGAVFVVPLPNISQDPNDYLAVSAIRMPDDLGDDLCGTDVALLRLKKPLADVTPLEPRVDVPLVAGESYSAVGFGIDESLPDKPSSERKRLDGLEVACNDDACRGGDVRDNEWIGSGGPCQGDSGGPALDADGKVVGVVSRGKSGCTEPVFSDVVTRAAWLRKEAVAAASAAHQTPESWACNAENPCSKADAGEPEETCAFVPPRTPGVSAWLFGLGVVAAVLRVRPWRLAKPWQQMKTNASAASPMRS